MYEGTDWATALIRISLPTSDKDLPFQPFSFFQTLSMENEKMSFLVLLNTNKSPQVLGMRHHRLYTHLVIDHIPHLLINILTKWCLRLVQINHLSRAMPISLNNPYNDHCLLLVSVRKQKLSSANNKWEIRGALLATWIPWIPSLDTFDLINLESMLAPRMNRYEESGSPWRNPLSSVKLFLGYPLIRISYVTIEIHIWITKTSLAGKHIAINIFFQKLPFNPIICLWHI